MGAAEESPDLTELLHRACQGDRVAGEQLVPHILGECQRLARGLLRRQRIDHTLQTMALVNEAWLKLFHGKQRPVKDRQHFFALAATVMRTILVDHARRRGRAKRGSDATREPLDDLVAAYEEHVSLVDLNEALQQLSREDPELVRVFELRFILGLSVPELAATVGRPVRTVERQLQFARAWLKRRLGESP